MFHDRAQLCSLNGASSRKALVSRKAADGCAVIGVKQGAERFGFIGVRNAEKIGGDCLVFEKHSDIDDVGVKRPFIARSVPKRGKRIHLCSLRVKDGGKGGDPRLVVALL